MTLLVNAVMTATVAGRVTNGVKVHGRNGRPSRGRKPPRRVEPTNPRPEPPVKRARKPSRVPRPKRGYRVFAMSVPVDELAWIDAMATTCQMSRSEFLLQASKHYEASFDASPQRPQERISLSMPPEAHALITQLAGPQNRSRFLREAARFFGTKLFPSGEIRLP